MSPTSTKIGPEGPILSGCGYLDAYWRSSERTPCGRLVGLREHARAGLLQDVELGEVRHLLRHVDVADAALGRGQVLLVGRQVVQAVLEAVLHGAEFGADLRDVLDRVVERGRGWQRPPDDSAAAAAAASLMPVISRHAAAGDAAGEVRGGRGDRLAVVGADLEGEARRAEQRLAVELRARRGVRDVLDLVGDLVDLGARSPSCRRSSSVPLPYWTLRSRTRCSIECTSASEPSAVCTSEMPSCALRCA